MKRLICGAATAVVALLATGCGPGLQSFSIGRSVSGPTYKLTAVFGDASGLPIGGHVELHDVTIGKVDSLTTDNFHAYVHMVIQSSTKLPKGTTATLALTTPLGEEYVNLIPPQPITAPVSYLQPDGLIPPDATNRAPDVEDLLSAFSAVLNGGGVGQIQTIVGQLNVALSGHTASGRQLIGHLNTILAELADHTTEIDNTLTSISSLSKELAAQHRLIVRGLTQLKPGIAALHADTHQFARLLTHISTVGQTATDVLNSVQGTLLTDLDDLAPTLDTLVSLRGRLGSTLRGLRNFALNLDRAIPGDYLNLNGFIQVTQ
jgi:phospholipid/cholesterol/gamma-HCH transport system substrate-binding protein